ncbi:MAG: hypothetical protein QOG01_355 [Pseudonocardiales bacterium]|jgi:hypothetical protein|nr:hypothetical protein [Pseudonocardiales bacterium]
MTWALSALLGGIAVGVAAARPEPQPRTLSPRTVARYLADLVPAERDDVRVNGIYGSGHMGAWQFVAHVTWHTADGTIDGGVTNLPILASEPPWASPVDPSTFPHEHEVGWTLDQVAAVFARAEDTDDYLAMVELEITSTRDSVIACHAARADQVGHCAERERNGHPLRQFDATLTDDPLGQATAVQRA